ncbi:MAG: hypothetical protein OHK0057_29750 [Thermoflexibacter sp.]
MKNDIFISFADEDKSFALELCDALQSEGLKVWCSAKDVPIGADIHAEVSKALPNCLYFLPIISPNYGRFWHEKEFHSASHNRPNHLIIPVTYLINYDYIKNNAMFSLISSIRVVATENKSPQAIASEIADRIRQKSEPAFPEITFQSQRFSINLPSIWLKHKTWIASSFFAFSAIVLFLFIQSLENQVDVKNMPLTSSLNENNTLLQDSIDANHPDFYNFKLVDVKSEKNENFLQTVYKDLLVSKFILFNDTSQDLDIEFIKIEAIRNNYPAYEQKASSLQLITDSTQADSPIFALDLPKEEINAHYLFTLTPTLKCLKGTHLTIPLIIYQKEQKKYVLPDPNTDLVVHFITKQKIYAKSGRLYFEDAQF